MKYTVHEFGRKGGLKVDEIDIYNDNGNRVSFLNIGARVNGIFIGSNKSLSLGFDNLEEIFENRNYYLGAAIGRIAGRIPDANFYLKDKLYSLDTNEGKNHLHGGSFGFDFRIWTYSIDEKEDSISLHFYLDDIERKGYYPGNLKVEIVYSFDNDDNLSVEYKAISDKDTLFNPTFHIYFNLSEEDKDISNHILKVCADEILETDVENIPTGERRNIVDSEIDLNKGKKLSEILCSMDREILKNRGFDTLYLLNSGKPVSLKLINSNKSLEIETDDRVHIIV